MVAVFVMGIFEHGYTHVYTSIQVEMISAYLCWEWNIQEEHYVKYCSHHI